MCSQRKVILEDSFIMRTLMLGFVPFEGPTAQSYCYLVSSYCRCFCSRSPSCTGSCTTCSVLWVRLPCVLLKGMILPHPCRHQRSQPFFFMIGTSLALLLIFTFICFPLKKLEGFECQFYTTFFLAKLTVFHLLFESIPNCSFYFPFISRGINISPYSLFLP